MQSSGGIISARLAAREPVALCCRGRRRRHRRVPRAALAGFERIIGFDMGGTSTDVFLADAAAGGAELNAGIGVAACPSACLHLDIHTV